jgi:hypothetical protein
MQSQGIQALEYRATQFHSVYRTRINRTGFIPDHAAPSKLAALIARHESPGLFARYFSPSNP